MRDSIDLRVLANRESEQTEGKENVADIDDVVATLSAFANDLQNLGGGYVVCGAQEEKDAHGFPKLVLTGLTAARFKEIEGTTLARCRDRVSPPIAPLVEELPAEQPDRRILVFVQPATDQAHTFRRGNDGGKHFVRISRSTIEARNGVLRNLLVRKGALEPWDRRPCNAATENDIDLLALREALQRMGVFSSERGLEPYLSEYDQLSPFVPPLFIREPLTGVLRPRNFAILLFGRETQRFIPGAFSIFSMYPGTDRSDAHSERHEVAGNLLEQARRLGQLLDVQSHVVSDKANRDTPNVMKYPTRALYEAMGNALAHRNYEDDQPTRITVFSDRIEVLSPGSLPLGVEPSDFRQGRASPKWRNQTLAWFFTRLQLAQAEGQGIPTILRVMREEGCPPPTFDTDESRVLCVLPAHPRHAILQDLRSAEQALALGQLERAQAQIDSILARDPLNYRAIQLFAEVHQALRAPAAVVDFVSAHLGQMDAVPAPVLLQLAEALVSGGRPSDAEKSLSKELLARASRGRLEERELRRVLVAMLRAREEESALALIEQQLQQNPEWGRNPSLLQLRGDALLGLAKHCSTTGRNSSLPEITRKRAWQQFHAYLDRAEHDLKQALDLSVDAQLTTQINRNLAFLSRLRKENQRPRSGRR
jgi:predicted HTH transcriptional regulator